MVKLKLFALLLVYIVLLVVSIPVIALLLICSLIISGTLKVGQEIIWDVGDGEVTREWNKLVDLIAELIYNLRDSFVAHFGI